jgi:flagellar M-ring protein FliF
MATAIMDQNTAGNFTPATVGGTAMTTTGNNAPAVTNGGGFPPALNAPTNYASEFKDFVRTVLTTPATRRYLPLVMAVVAAIVFGVLYASMTATVFRVLVPNMSEADKQAAYEALDVSQLNPRIDTATGQLTVPTENYHRARIVMASQGLPRAVNTGGIDSLKEQNAMTTSQYMEQVRVNAAIEQELSYTISKIDAISAARVHLAQPHQSVFVRDRVPPKASVVVSSYSGRVIEPSHVKAIVHMVASSVPFLSAENVTVVDTTGNLLTASSQADALGLTSAQTEHKQKLEQTYRQRIEEILAPIAGPMNVRSQVNLVLDFTETESTQEAYDNADKGPKTRSEVLAQDNTMRADAAGVPGALSNVPPPDAGVTTNTAAATNTNTNQSGTSSKRETRNYELDRTVRHTKSATGQVERLSVAVVINEPAPDPLPADAPADQVALKSKPFTDAELEHMQSLVRMVVGYNAERGDVVTVVPAQFKAAPPMPTLPWYEDETIMRHAKTGVIATLFVLFLLTVVRPVVKHLIAPPLVNEEGEPLAPGELSADDLKMIQLGDGESLEEIKAKLKPKKSSISMDMLDTANTYDDKVALVRMLVAEDTARVANVLKSMIKPT